MPSLTDDAVLTRIQSRVPQCPVPNIKLELIDTYFDFLEFTKTKRQVLAPVATVVDQASYPLAPPDGYQVDELRSVLVNKIPLEEKSPNHLDIDWEEISRGYSFSYRHDLAFSGLDEPSWRYATSTQPRFYFIDEDGELRLVGIPQTVYTGANGIICEAVLKPIPASITTIDDGIWNDNYQTLVAGTLERLLLLPEKPWTNTSLAAYYGGQYNDGRNAERDRVARGNIRADRPVYHSKAYA